MGWTFSWLRSWDEIWAEGHLDDWRAAIAAPEAHATPFMHPDLARAWLRTMGGQENFTPHFLHAEHACGARVLWLLVRPRTGWRRGFLRWMVPIGGGLFDYNDPIIVPAAGFDAAILADFWARIEAELNCRRGSWFDVLDFRGLRSDCACPIAPGAAGGSISPLIRLSRFAGFDHYLATRNGDFRRRLQRAQRRLAAEGALGFVMHTPDEIDTVLDWLPVLEAEKRRRYPETSFPEGYFRNLVTEGLASGVVKCSSITLDGRGIAWMIGFHLHRTYYAYITAFDDRYLRFSPGSQHLYHLTQWAFANGCHQLDLLAGDETYKSVWTDGEAVLARPLVLRSRALATVSRRTAERGRLLCQRLTSALPRPPRLALPRPVASSGGMFRARNI